jgi:capsular exopolysaccharide synthesis family protein
MAERGGVPDSSRHDLRSGRGGTTPAANRFRDDAMLPILSDRHSHPAEEFRKLAVQLETRAHGAGRVSLVVSPLEGEGKTVTAANLALALAEKEGRRVLLLDLDLRRPRIEPFLAEQGRAGLADILREDSTLDAAVQSCRREHLHVLTAGKSSGRSLLRLEPGRMTPLLRRLREEYDWIVGDCPPLLPFAETRALAALAEDVVLVVRAEQTPRASVAEALAVIDEEKLAGVVLNAVPEGHWMHYGYRYAYGNREGGPERS